MGINLSGTLAAARGKGIDSLDAFVGVVDSVVAKNGEFQALQAKLKTATGSDRRDILASQADILQGSAIGQLVQDRQALMALVGIMGNRGYMSDVQKRALAGEGAAEKNYAVISQEAGFKVQQASNEKTFATQNAFEKLTPLVGAVAVGFTTIAQEFPLFTASTIAATTALTALAAASMGATLMGGKGGGLTSLLSKGKSLAVGAGGLALRGGAAALSLGGLAVAGAGAGGYGAGTLVNKYAVEGTEFGDNLGGMIATILAKLGNETAQEALNVTLHLDGEQIAAAVNLRNARTSTRN
ncbi:MAG: tail tape measure protein, partial [Sideroxydans sp.]